MLYKNYSAAAITPLGGKDDEAPAYDIPEVIDYKLAHFTTPHNLDGRFNHE